MQPTYKLHPLRSLILAMAVVAVAISASTITLLYRTAYHETLRELADNASTLANVIEAVARFDKRYSSHTHPQGSWGATMSQIEAGMLLQGRALQRGEVLIGRRIGNDLHEMRAVPGKGLQEVTRQPYDGTRAQALYLALNQQHGSGELIDYAGTRVLAGYAPVPSLDIGIVYKIDLETVRAPFVRASLWAAALAVVLIALGAIVFALLTRPLQRKIEQSEQRFSSLLAAAPVGVFETDLEGHCTFVNERWCELAGLTPQEALGEGWVQALHPEDGKRVFTAWQTFVEQQIPFGLEFRFLRRDGSVRWMFGQASTVRDENGNVMGYIGTVTDLTDSVQARAALRESEAHLNEAQRLAQVGSWELDLTTNRLAWSDEIFRIFEIDKSQFGASYEAFLHAIHPEDREMVNQAYTDSVASRTPYQIIHRLLMEDGRVKWVEERGETFYGTDGKPLRSSGTVQDISKLKETERELERYRVHLEDLVTQRTAMLEEAQHIAHMGNWSWDVASGKLVWSDEIYRIFGHEPRSFEPTYERFIATLHPDDVARIKESEQLAFECGEHHSIDHRIVLPTGEIRWVHEEAVAQVDANGNPITLAGTMQDITERKLAEERLIRAKEEAERANAAKSDFLSRMSHELRTPMNAILGFAQVLELDDLRPDQLDSVAEIHKAGDHLLELINELLDLSRIDVGKFVTTIEHVDVAPAVAAALQLASPWIEQRRVSVINNCQSEIGVFADRMRLRQILLNLISNAAKYNRDGGSIRIDCTPRGDDHCRLSVTDTGPGIVPEKLARLFQPFERLGAEFTAVDGTGIGLALSRKLAELMGAELGVASTPGQGTTFWIELPRAQQSVSASVPPTAPGAGRETTSRYKVLYIEDNAANLKVVEAMLRHQPSIMLLSATTGEYGLELARRYHPDVILLDIHLPGMGGYATLNALQAHLETGDIPVIALSADAMPLDIERGLKAGFSDYLTKPVKVRELLGALEGVLKRTSGELPGDTCAGS